MLMAASEEGEHDHRQRVTRRDGSSRLERDEDCRAKICPKDDVVSVREWTRRTRRRGGEEEVFSSGGFVFGNQDGVIYLSKTIIAGTERFCGVHQHASLTIVREVSTTPSLLELREKSSTASLPQLAVVTMTAAKYTSLPLIDSRSLGMPVILTHEPSPHRVICSTYSLGLVAYRPTDETERAMIHEHHVNNGSMSAAGIQNVIYSSQPNCSAILIGLDVEKTLRAMGMSDQKIQGVTNMKSSPSGALLSGYNFYNALPVFFFPWARSKTENPHSIEDSLLDFDHPLLVFKASKGSDVYMWHERRVLRHAEDSCENFEIYDFKDDKSIHYQINFDETHRGRRSCQILAWSGGKHLIVCRYDIIALVFIKKSLKKGLIPIRLSISPLSSPSFHPSKQRPVYCTDSFSIWLNGNLLGLYEMPKMIPKKSQGDPLLLRPLSALPITLCGCFIHCQDELNIFPMEPKVLRISTRSCTIHCPINVCLIP